MRVALICMEQSRNHGWAKFCLNLSRILSRQPGVSLKNGLNSELAGKADCEPHFILKSNHRHDPKYFQILGDLLSNFKILRTADIIVAGDEFSFPVSYLAARLFGKRLILNIHGTYALKGIRGKRGSLYVNAYRYAEKICSVSNYTKNRLVEIMPELSEKISVIPLASIADSSFAMPSQQQQANHFVIIGEVKPRKGVNEAILAIKLLREKRYDIQLKVIGNLDGYEKYVDDLRQLIDRCDLQSHVEFCGFVPEARKDELTATAISNLLPSQNDDQSFEGFGFVHLEAGLLGVPSIGSLNCGNEDAIIDGKTGFLIAQGNVAELAVKMEMLCADRKLRNKMGLAAQEHVASWTWHDVGERYKQLLGG